MTTKPYLTAQQLADWREYERVRSAGFYNMFSREARLSTGLLTDNYFFVMQNYEALQDAQPQQKTTP